MNVSVWSYEEGRRLGAFKNDTSKPSRMTTISWLNEASSSLLLTGSDDGVLRYIDSRGIRSKGGYRS
jgi:hypothetical protein